ncbi:MAG: sporulation protein Cse60 [Erysipelotrichaceae bacterium]|nr:sporulation protein Cse60 [Erysipelotrichaceae bacterium]
MKIKIIESTHELDLQDALNDFIVEDDPHIISLHYAVAMTSLLGELEYSFSCLIVYS